MKSLKTLETAHWLCNVYSRESDNAVILLRSSFVKILVVFGLILLASFTRPESPTSSRSFEISGNIFFDENENGIKDINEVYGIEGVIINVYDDSEALMNTIVSDENGDFVFANISEIETCRLEFSLSNGLGEIYAASHYGVNNGTLVQFIKVGTEAHLGLKMIGNDCIEDIPTNVANVVPWGPTTKKTLLDHGIGVATCSAYPLYPLGYRYVVGLLNLPDVETTVDTVGVPSVESSYPGMFHHPDWVASKMGNVFGIEIDEEFNMYVTASSQIWQRAINAGGEILEEDAIKGVWRYGDIGGGADDLEAAGTIYKIDAYTGKASVFAVLPQQSVAMDYFSDAGMIWRESGPGLGNIAFNNSNKTFYVTNFEDGKIYHLDEDGEILDTYDPFQADNGAVGFAPFGELIWGIDIYQDKLYFSNWISATLTHPYSGDSEVHSIELDSNGGFIGNEKLEFTYTIPNNSILYSPIADIEINEDGRMLVAQRTMLNRVTVYNHQSASSIYELNEVTGEWENAGNLRVGHSGPSECYGGAAWDPAREMIWVSSADINAGYGPHGIMGVPTNQFQPGFEQASEWAIVPYTPPGSTEDIKGFGGDIALANLNLYRNCSTPEIEVGNYIWEDINGDGIQGASEKPLEGVIVQLLDNEMNLIGQDITDEIGHYFFNKYNVDVNGIQILQGGFGSPNSGAFTGITKESSYYIVVGEDQDVNKQMELNGILYELTASNEGNNDLIDSDGISEEDMFGGRPYNMISTGEAGENIHNFDFGWKLQEPFEFEATAIDNSYALLDWITLQEVNSHYFEVQRSKSAISWETIATVDAAGFSISEKYYTLNDLDPYMGISYYKIEWFDFDGTSVFSQVREVEFTEPEVVDGFSGEVVYPNPVQGTLPILFDLENFENVLIDIYRVDGALMYKGESYETQTDIDISGFASGNYVMLLKINNAKEQLVERLTIKN